MSDTTSLSEENNTSFSLLMGSMRHVRLRFSRCFVDRRSLSWDGNVWWCLQFRGRTALSQLPYLLKLILVYCTSSLIYAHSCSLTQAQTLLCALYSALLFVTVAFLSDYTSGCTSLTILLQYNTSYLFNFTYVGLLSVRCHVCFVLINTTSTF